jgi:hypothetical protein
MTADLAEEQTAAQLATERLESEQVHTILRPRTFQPLHLRPCIPALSQQFYTLAFRTSFSLYIILSYQLCTRSTYNQPLIITKYSNLLLLCNFLIVHLSCRLKGCGWNERRLTCWPETGPSHPAERGQLTPLPHQPPQSYVSSLHNCSPVFSFLLPNHFLTLILH